MAWKTKDWQKGGSSKEVTQEANTEKEKRNI